MSQAEIKLSLEKYLFRTVSIIEKKEIRKGVINGLYPNFFTVEIANENGEKYPESFLYADIYCGAVKIQ